jgi:hypothetical protein
VTRRAPISVSFFLLATPVLAQVQLGNFNLTGSGNVSAGYTGDFGNQVGSDHGVTFGGIGTLNGYFYDPGFLNFNIQPFLNQSRENSNYQSISDSSGVNASSGIFTGSNFPGMISFTKTFNAQGNYNVPGITDFTSRGDAQNLNVSWSENVPNLPHLTVSFLDGSDNYSLYGASGNLISSYRSLSAQTNYRIAGFNLLGTFRDSSNASEIPSILGSPAETTDSDTLSYSVGVGHALPFHGSISAAASRSEVDGDFSTGSYKATVDTLNGGMGFTPTSDLTLGANFQYTDDLAGTIDQTIVAAGGTVANTPQPSSHSLDLIGFANYRVMRLHLTFSASEEHRDQAFLGESYAADTSSGSISYGNHLLGGFLNATAGVTRSVIGSSNQSQLGYFGTLNYLRDVGRWSFSATGNYAQNTQTILIAYTSSGYGYSGNVSRKLGKRSHWSATGTGSKSTLSNEPGAGTFSQSYSTAFTVKWIGASGAYSRSNGNSILTASGLTPITVPLPVLAPSSVILYGGHSYSGSLGISPIRGLTMSLSYAEALADTQGDSVSSHNRTKQLNAFLQYRLRKIYFTAGYSQLTQSFSSNGSVPVMVGSYYFGLTRWFNFL